MLILLQDISIIVLKKLLFQQIQFIFIEKEKAKALYLIVILITLKNIKVMAKIAGD